MAEVILLIEDSDDVFEDQRVPDQDTLCVTHVGRGNSHPEGSEVPTTTESTDKAKVS